MKTFIKKYSFLIMSFLLLPYSCDKNNNGDCCSEPSLTIYNLKGDYISNVCVGLTDDKSRIYVYPDPSGNCGNPEKSPFKMKEDYYLDGCCNYGINSAYLSISKEEYQDIFPISKDSMMKLILDNDPYIEYYIDDEDLLWIKGVPDTTPYFAIDTALLNEIITNHELDKYFTRLK